MAIDAHIELHITLLQHKLELELQNHHTQLGLLEGETNRLVEDIKLLKKELQALKRQSEKHITLTGIGDWLLRIAAIIGAIIAIMSFLGQQREAMIMEQREREWLQQQIELYYHGSGD